MAKGAWMLLLGGVVSCRGLLMSHEKQDKEQHFQGCLSSYAKGLDEVRQGLGQSVWEFMKIDPSSWNTSDREVFINVGPGTTGTHLFKDVMVDHFKLMGWHFGKNDYSVHLMDALGVCYPEGVLVCKSHGESASKSMPATRQAACYKDVRTFNYASFGENIRWLGDVPFPELFVHMYRAFPNAKFVLTTRPSEEWAQMRLQDHNTSVAMVQEPCGIYTRDFSVKEHAQMLTLHNDLVRCAVDKTQLFELDIFAHPEVIDTFAEELGAFLHLAE